MFDRNRFALRLKELRAASGLTGREVADIVGLKNRASISQFETRVNTPSAEILTELADLFCVSLDHLTGRDTLTEIEHSKPVKIPKSKEQALIMKFRSLSPADQARVRNFIDALAKTEKEAIK